MRPRASATAVFARFAAALMGLALVAAPLALAATASAPPAHADTSNFTFDSFDADYTLSRDADGTSRLEVVETIVARFPDFDQYRGIIRAIPTDYDGVPLSPEVTSVTDASGASVPFEAEDAGEFLELALGTDDFVRGVQTYVISYTLENVVRSFENTGSDELYWDVNGTGWDQPFGRVSVTLTLTDDVAAALTGNAACYVGPQGSTEQCPIDAAANPITASATDLGPGETLSLAVGFTAGTFATPEPTEPPLGEPIIPLPLPTWMLGASAAVGLASIAALVAGIVVRIRAPRGAQSRFAIIPQYSEPRGIDILQAAHLVKRPATGIPATLVRLAVRKNIRILAYQATASSAPYTLQYRSDTGADDLDRAVLTALFGADREQGALTPYGEYDAALTSALNGIAAEASRAVTEQGWKRRAPRQGTGAVIAALSWTLFIIAITALIASDEIYGQVSPLLAIAAALGFSGSIITTVLAVRPLQLTERGRELTDHLEGMRLYLTVAEEDRLRALQSPQGAERIDVGDGHQLVKLYEKLLPWAVLWGVEDQWMRELAVRASAAGETPDFFVGPEGFQVALFVTALNGFQKTMTDPATSEWSSSGTGSMIGGSFGGGFAGGGGGGGGGGGR
ncbi:putative membrane protein DUF2207 [Microcella putealis]|uniref:Putative membrane protein DUF2207 n=1 Tax=Microcella putealis TaxID=337005 RepID=A0A4Q7LI57_9MICO|nr:DUF2207 domain-containing protein [Microcella putealis]RZS53447.1 putative membrane protein DUF2207 [Microcella putealis]TQM26891.1 putative membrane protein DUF2207 [Microcella putealis]